MVPTDTISAQIAPSRNGSPSGWITYTGEVGGADSAWARYGLTYLKLTNQYVSVRGFRFRGGLTYDYSNLTNQANFDSVSWCRAQALALHGCHNTVTYGCIFYTTAGGNSVEAMGENGITGPNWPQCSCCSQTQHINSASMWNTIRQCKFTNTNMNGSSKLIYTHYTWFLTVDSTQMTGTITGSSGDGPAGLYFYNNHNCTISDSKFTLDNTSGIDQKGFSYRDSTQDMLQLRDTLYFGLAAGSITSRLANSGNPCQDGQVIRNKFLSSVWIMSNKAYGQELIDNFVIDSCVIVCVGNPPLSIENGATNCEFAYNTLAGGSPSTAFGYLFRGSKGNGGIFSTIRLTDNIFYCDSVGTVGSEHFSRFTEWGSGNLFDRNLFYFRSHNGSISDPSLYCAGNAQENGGGAPGVVVGGRCFSDQQECNSAYADPLLVNTSLTSAFDAHLQSNSPASTTWHGTWNNGQDHVGAYRYVQTIAPVDSAYLALTSSAYIAPAGGGHVVRRLVIDWYLPTPAAGSPAYTSVTLAAANDGTIPNVPVIASYVNTYTIGTFGPPTPLEGQEYVYNLTEPAGEDVDVYVVLRLTNAAGLSTYSRVGPF